MINFTSKMNRTNTKRLTISIPNHPLTMNFASSKVIKSQQFEKSEFLKIIHSKPTVVTRPIISTASQMSSWTPPSHPSSSPQHQSQSHFRPVMSTVGHIPNFDNYSGTPPPSEQEKILYAQEKQRERLAVVNQPHRTFPVVTPKPKPIHDYPTGSYLKYVKDPTWNQPARVSSPIPRPDKLREVMNKYARELDAEKVVHLQYNSPLNVYSNQSIAETLVPQAMMSSPNGTPVSQHYPEANRLSVSPVPNFHGGHQQQRPTTPLTDIRKSPTWQLIQEQEQAKAYMPVKERVNSPVGATLHVSSIDGHDQPAQSQTFKYLMTALCDHPAY